MATEEDQSEVDLFVFAAVSFYGCFQSLLLETMSFVDLDSFLQSFLNEI